MQSSKILLKDGQTVDLVDGRIADGDIDTWNNKLNVDGSNATNAGVTAMMKKLGSVGDASTPIYLNNGVVQEATGVNSHINDSSIHLPSVLPISRGGTGADDRTEAEYNLLGSISDSEVTDESTLDNRKIPLVNSSISITNGVFRFLSFSVIWNWIKHKLGISASGSSTKYLNEQGEWSDTIAKARAVIDYGATSKAIEIGWGGKSIQNPTYFAVYTDSANGYNKAIKDCSLENTRKAINGTSVGSTAVPVFINAKGAPQVCTDDFVHDGDVTDSNPTLAWGTTSTIGTVGGKALRVTMPSNPASGMAEDFFAMVTQSTFEDVKSAYNAGKRIVGVLGGTTSGGNPFRQETPLAFLVIAGNMPFAFTFLFENARPKTASGEGVGSTTIYTLSSSGWSTSTHNVDYAETAGTANMAAKLSTVDTAPKKGSSNMVTSDGLWNDTPSPIAYYFDSTGIIGIYNGSRRADEVVIRNCSRFRLTTSWLKNFSGRTFKIHNAMSANLEISVQVEAGLKLLLTDEFNSSVKTYDNTSGSSSAETRSVLFLLPGETLRLYVIYTSGTTDVALFIIGSGRWSVFSPTYDRYRRVEGISCYQRLCYAKTSGSPGSKGNVHLYDGKNWHNLCNITSNAGTVRIAGLDSSRTPDNPATNITFDGYMNIVTGLTLTRNGYMGMLYGYVAPKQSIAFRLPTASSDMAESYTQSGKTLANCSELRIDGFDTDAVGAGHAVFTSSSLLHITLLSGTLTFAIAGDFSVFTTGASYFFSIPLSFGNLTA